MKVLTSMLTALAVFGVVLVGLTKAEAADPYGKQKVVYHINYEGGEADKKYRGALRNIQNHINAVGAENMDIKVVLHGNGLGVLKNAKSNDKLKGQVVSLKSQNVKFNVCNNTLKGRKINYETDLLEVFPEDIVPSGVAELSHLQQMGYTYIKP
ncbi:DsrE family protein [bacterium SCSIO 12827]|nr:DsrE family protein [bacterium SCSIO 12827]